MASRPWSGDAELMAEIALAQRSMPVPEAVLRQARAAFSHRRPRGGVLACISYDSVLDDEPGMRGPEPDDRRIISFNADSASVEIEVSADRLTGQLVPAVEAEVELVGTAGRIGRTRSDDLGCFVFERPEPGAVQFRCHSPAGDVVTDWVLL
jgi:hypothetical protein